MTRVINLKNGLKFVILSELELENEMYLYLSSMDKEINFIFAKVIDATNIQPVSDERVIAKLMKLIDVKFKDNNLFDTTKN